MLLVLSPQALLPSHTGTLAECVSQLLVQLVLACHMMSHSAATFFVLPLQALLPSHTGTLAECVSQLLVQLVLACHMMSHLCRDICRAALAGTAAKPHWHTS
jgi:hypothetical protein